MPTPLPSQLYHARCVRVHSPQRVEVALRLGFGVTANKSILLEGVNRKDYTQAQWGELQHVLIVLLGGKHLLVHTDNTDSLDGHVPARVYLDEMVSIDQAYMGVPFTLTEPRLEVTKLVHWLKGKGFDMGILKAVLNNRGENAH
jgi:hypothetical protein